MPLAQIATAAVVTYLAVGVVGFVGWDWWIMYHGNPDTDTISQAFRNLSAATGGMLVCLLGAVVIHLAAFRSCWTKNKGSNPNRRDEE